MIISVICPLLNEEKYIRQLISFLKDAEPKDKEIIFVDGGSTDKTLELIVHEQSVHRNITLIHNPARVVPQALNLAIPVCQAEIIVRIDAHCKYDQNYFTKILETFTEIKADIVGGPTRTAYNGPIQESVAFAICTRFAIGDSKVHDVSYRGYTDSVTFGAWRKSIFERTGLFDIDLIRNQDDEFHYRAKSLGLRIYQNPDIKLFYYPRDSLIGLFKQYYEYGLYKPLVLKKIRSGARPRHFIPSFFCVYLLSIPLAFAFNFWVWPLIFYFVLNLFFSFFNTKRVPIKFILLIVYPTIHIGYGLGFIGGLLRKSK